MDLKFLIIICCVIFKSSVATYVSLDWEPTHPAFDPKIYENALDSELCSQQLQYIRRNTALRLRFLEAGMRLPRGILDLNFRDMGNYDQCLNINEDIETSVIEGKYCMIRTPVDETFTEVAQNLNWSDYDPYLLTEEAMETHKLIKEMEAKLEPFITRVDKSRSMIGNSSILSIIQLRMALCVPKTCTTEEGIRGLLFNLNLLGFRYSEIFCRFKDDKPWAPADYVAIVIFSIIGFLTVLSTGYDLCHTFISKKDPKTASQLYKSFSVYTNGKRLTTFTYNPNNLNCVDGIRSISMFWIVVGHTYQMCLLMPLPHNVSYIIFDYISSLKSLWITAAPFSVDTFFFLSGMLVVYTTVEKINGKAFLKSLHLFYLNRLLRMFPLLATLVLLQASLMHRMADGPDWRVNAVNTENCRNYWWATLFYVQNYVNVDNQCVAHSWYLAIDMQCYIISPIILYWVLNDKATQAWTSLSIGVLASLAVCATWCFINKFQGWTIGQVRPGGEPEFHIYYYFNTLSRAPPFFVGMLFGYILHTWKGKKLQIPLYLNFIVWILSGATMMVLMYITHLMKDQTWDLWIIDDLNNTFARSIWAVAVGWIIFSCQHGYGGPINWFLCLDIWKLPSRISYGMYLFHYHIQFMIRGTLRQLEFFSDATAMYNFFAQVLICYGVAFTLTLLIDSPCSTLIKLALGGGFKKSPEARVKEKQNRNVVVAEKEIGELKENANGNVEKDIEDIEDKDKAINSKIII